MPLVNLPTAPAPADTVQSKQERTSEQIRRLSSQLAAQLINGYRQIKTLVGANPFGLTSEEVFAGLGSDGANLPALAEGLKQLLQQAAPDAVSKFTEIDESVSKIAAERAARAEAKTAQAEKTEK